MGRTALYSWYSWSSISVSYRSRSSALTATSRSSMHEDCTCRSQPAGAPERPDLDHHPSDHARALDRAEESAVIRGAPIVPHDEERSFGHVDGREVRGAHVVGQVGLDQEAVVDVEVAAAGRD